MLQETNSAQECWTVSQIELTFPSAAAAVAYARRQGLRYLLQGADDPDTRPGSNAKAANTNSASPDIRLSVIDALFDLDERQASTSAHRIRATGPDCEGRAA